MEYKDKLHQRIGKTAEFATEREAEAIEELYERIQTAQAAVSELIRKKDGFMYKLKIRSGELRRREDHPNNQKKEVPENAEARMARLFKTIGRDTNRNLGDIQ